MIYFMLCIVLMCQLIVYHFNLLFYSMIVVRLLCSLFNFLFIVCSILFSIWFFAFHNSLFRCSKERKKRYNYDPGLYSRYFDPVVHEVPVVPAVQEISSSSMQVNKHHTSDCTDFVLVWEREAYYEHRHSRIYKTNILQVVKHAEGETIIHKILHLCT
jgi:hypothetical protein